MSYVSYCEIFAADSLRLHVLNLAYPLKMIDRDLFFYSLVLSFNICSFVPTTPCCSKTYITQLHNSFHTYMYTDLPHHGLPAGPSGHISRVDSVGWSSAVS